MKMDKEHRKIFRVRLVESIARGKELGADSYSIVGPSNNAPKACKASEVLIPFRGTSVLPCCPDCFCWMNFHFPK